MTSEDRKLTRKKNKQKNKSLKKDLQKKIDDAVGLLLSNPKCFNEMCNNFFDFKTSNHDEWTVRAYVDKTILLCKDCSSIDIAL